MDLAPIIESAEHKFKQILEDFFLSVYDDKQLPSHGIDHHRRVWRFSKELLHLISEDRSESLITVPEKLIIACYLHDIGMSIETGVKHGKHSKAFCVIFLKQNNLSPANYKDVLNAITYHDQKEYPSDIPTNILFNLLSVSDDLDAFGFIGIFRYLEVYFKRKTSFSDIGSAIRNNAARRYYYLEKSFGEYLSFMKKQKKRYEIIDTFFTEYDNELINYRFNESKPTGYCGIVEIISRMTNSEISVTGKFPSYSDYFHDKITEWFFTGLMQEINIEK